MHHPYVRSGQAITWILMIALVAFGINYHISKTLLHLSGIVAISIWFRVLLAPILNADHQRSISVNVRDPGVILAGLLLTSAIIVFGMTALSDASMSVRFRKDFFVAALCFALVLPVCQVSQTSYRMLYWLFPIAAMTMAIPGISDHLTRGSQYYRTSGTIDLPIIYGMNLAIVIAATVTLCARSGTLLSILSAVAASAIGFYAVILSGSRGPVLSLIVIVLTGVALYGYKRLGLLKAVALTITFLVAMMALVTQTSIYKRFEIGLKNVEESTANSSIGLRLEMWKGARDIVIEHPLTGSGVGKHNEILAQKHEIDPDYIHENATKFIHLHNDVLNAVTWMGIPLGLLFIAFVFYPFIWASFQRFYGISAVVAAVSMVYIINGMTNTPSIRATSLTLLLLVMTLLLRHQRLSESGETPSTASSR